VFTGIVEEVGTVRGTEPRANGVVLDVAARAVLADLRVGASLAVQGVCQTVLDHDAAGFRIAAEAETLRVTTLGALRPGARVNLERALGAAGRFDGHLVLGHVDGTVRVAAVHAEGRTHVLEIEIPETLLDFVVPKGCIALDGVSLTVGPTVEDGRCAVYLIPHTWENTSLADVRAGARLNVEVDVVGRYVVQLAQRGKLGGAAPARDLSWDAVTRALGPEEPA